MCGFKFLSFLTQSVSAKLGGRMADRRHLSSPAPGYIFMYTGPSPPCGGTQLIFWLGSLMSQVLQCTQFCALMTKVGSVLPVPVAPEALPASLPSSTHS